MASITDDLMTLAELSPLETMLIRDLGTYYLIALSIVAAVTALAWDTLLTLEEERKYVWKSSWRSIKYLYLTFRYLAILVQGGSAVLLFTKPFASDQICLTHKYFAGVGLSIMMGSADMLLIYRVFAFCGRDKNLLYFLISLYICTHVTSCTLVFVSAQGLQEVANPIARLRPIALNCLVVSYHQTVVFIWPVMLTFQSILFSCVILRVIFTRYSAWNGGIALCPLYTVFVRDGLWAYSAIVLNLMLCVISSAKHSPFVPASFLWLITTGSVCGCRLILNLRGIYDQQSSATATEALAMQTKDLLNIRFQGSTGQETTSA